MNDPAKIKEVKARLVEAGVQYCFATFVDVHGVPKAKTVPIDSFEKMAKGSELFTVGALEGLGLIGPEKDECAAVPDLDTCTILPWDKRFAWFASDLYFHGQPYQNDPRVILKRVMKQARDAGFVPNLGIESEFYVFREGDAGPRPLSRQGFKGPTPCYDVFQTVQSMEFLDPMARYFDELGWGLYSFDQEGGHGQYELDSNYADALTTADRTIFLRFMIKAVATSIGATASFMPKPFSTDFRSGAHHNMSLASIETGENLFDQAVSGVGELGRRYNIGAPDIMMHFAAGILAHAPALCAITCPTFNSYKGLVAQGDMPDMSWAPVLRAYGANNRSAMLRLPMNRPCVENRAPDMSANFYLSAAFNFAAGLDGVKRKADPGEPLNDNLYLRVGRVLNEKNRVLRLPRTLVEALDAFDDDPFTTEVFGPEFPDIYVAQKMKEWQSEFYFVGPEERAKHLTYV